MSISQSMRRGLKSGSHKSVRPIAGVSSDHDDDPSNPTVNCRGERRGNATHRSTTDRDARLARTRGQPARLAYTGHVMMDNRHGLIIDTELTSAGDGYAAVDAAMVLSARIRGRRRVTLGGDKAYDQATRG